MCLYIAKPRDAPTEPPKKFNGIPVRETGTEQGGKSHGGVKVAERMMMSQQGEGGRDKATFVFNDPLVTGHKLSKCQ